MNFLKRGLLYCALSFVLTVTIALFVYTGNKAIQTNLARQEGAVVEYKKLCIDGIEYLVYARTLTVALSEAGFPRLCKEQK